MTTNRAGFLTALKKIGTSAVVEGNIIKILGENIQLVNLAIRGKGNSDVDPFSYGFSPKLKDDEIICAPF